MLFTDQRSDVGLNRVLVHHHGVERVTVMELQPLHLFIKGLRMLQVQLGPKPRLPQQTEKGFIRERIQEVGAVHINQDFPRIGGKRPQRVKISVFRRPGHLFCSFPDGTALTIWSEVEECCVHARIMKQNALYHKFRGTANASPGTKHKKTWSN